MRGSFNGSQSPYVFDHGQADFYREQNQARVDREHMERCAHWLAVQLVGLTFTTLPELREVCLGLVEARYGIDDRMAGIVTKAVTALWLGQVERAVLSERAVKATVTESPRSVSFALAS